MEKVHDGAVHAVYPVYAAQIFARSSCHGTVSLRLDSLIVAGGVYLECVTLRLIQISKEI